MAGSWRYAPGDGVSVEMSTDVSAMLRELAERSDPIVARELGDELDAIFAGAVDKWPVGRPWDGAKAASKPHSVNLLDHWMERRSNSIDAILDSPAPYTLLIRQRENGLNPWMTLVDAPSELAADRLADRLAGLLADEVA